MKKLLLFLLFTTIVKAQIINFPDANFKARLLSANSSNPIASTQTPDVDGNVTTYNTIDTNGDGEIQSSEALAIQYLNVQRLSDIITGISSPIITNLSGISSFVNVKSLDCSSNQITSLILSGNYNLKKINCSYNLLTNLNLSNINGLKYLECFGNSQLSTLDLSTNPNITNLACYSNNLSSLNISNLLGLLTLNCNSNHITSLNINNNLNLSVLQCASNSLNSLNLSNNTLLTNLNCSYNLLTSLNVSNNTSLTVIHCGNNQLTALNIANNINLTSINIQGNQITSINFSNNPLLNYVSTRLNPLYTINVSNLLLLEGLVCSKNFLTTLNLTNNSNLKLLFIDINQFTSLPILPQNNGLLERLSCNDNLFTALDLSGFPNLNWLECENNYLTSLNIKNGNSYWDDSIPNPNFPSPNIPLHPNFQNNPNLTYICADDEDVDMVQDRITSYGYTNCLVNSYCSFIPGGTYYTIQGSNKLDEDNNGCDALDAIYPNLKINVIDDTVFSGSLITDNSGNYSIPVQAGTHTITPQFENLTYFNVSPATATVTFPATASPFIQDFCITPNGIHHDLEVVVIPINIARPGFDSVYKIKYKNKGNLTENTNINFNYNDAILDYVSSSIAPTTQATGTLSYNIGAILPFKSGEILVTLNLNSPIETPAVNGGAVLCYTATSNGLNTDETPDDNTFTLNQIVVNSFDPNDKTCLEGTIISPSNIGKYVHYKIRFENTGTFAAQNIVVKDMIDTTKFDIATLQMTDASHSFVTRITNPNKVEFIFENINLPFDDATNDGYVVFKIKTKPTLVVGNTISNSANIYFDYNFPIVTNTATSTFQTLQNDTFVFDNYLTMYPNPVKEELNLKTKQDTEVYSLTIYNILGQQVQTFIKPSLIIDVSTLKTGNYIIKVVTDKGISSSKFVKE